MRKTTRTDQSSSSGRNYWRILGLTAAIFAVLCAFSGYTYAGPGSLTIGAAAGAPGTSVDLPVSYTPGTTGVSALNFDVSMPAPLTYGTTATGSAASSAGKSASGNAVGGSVRVVVFGLNQNVMGAGDVAVIRFNIPSGATAGTLTLGISGIMASDASGNAVAVNGSSGSITITGSAPPAPTNLSPADGAAGVSINPTLSWSASSGATSYDVYFGTSSTPPLATNTAGTTYSPSTLAQSTVYYWRVVAKNGSGSNSSAIQAFTTTGAAPPTPANLSPADGATGVSINPTLSWSASSGATSYDVYFGTGVTPPLATNSTATTYSPSTLAQSTVYHWRIVAKNSFGSNSSGTQSFTTLGTAPPAPTNLIPSNGAAGVSINPTLSWSASSGASSYDVYFGTSATPSQVTSTTSTTYIPSTLTNNTIYYWRIVARNSFGSNSSGAQSFTTTGSAPPAPSNLSPSNGAANVSVNSALSWSTSSGATAYDVYLGTASTPPLATSITGTSYSPSALAPNTTYYWRVEARNSFGSNSSGTQTFTTANVAPQAPAGLSPANGATGVTLNPTLSWSASPGAGSYDVYFGIAGTPPLATSTTATTYLPSTLAPNTIYYWRIEARNGSGSNSSATQSFTTAGVAPVAPTNLSPANGTGGIPLNPTLSWSASAGADSYDVYFGTSITPPMATNTTGTSYAPPALNSLTTYYWRVVAKNTFGSNSSPTVNFATVGSAPNAPSNLNPANGAAGVPLDTTLSWSGSTGATSYDIYFGTGSAPPMLGSTGGTSYQPPALNSNTSYYWRVVARNSFGSTSSSTQSFATSSNFLPAPGNLNPADGAIGVPLNPTLSWSASNGADSYDVYFSSSSPPQLATTTTGTVYAPPTLSPGGTYYWRVVAKSGSSSNSSATASFTATGGGPSAPANLNPANGEKGVPLSTTLSWSASSGADAYDVYFGLSDPPPLSATTVATSSSVSGLSANTVYYWKVVAKSSAGSNSSATVGFTTTGEPPRVPSNLSPADGATGVTLNPTLSWSASNGADSYDVYFGTASMPPLATTSTVTDYSPSSLIAGTTYYWRVVARNSYGSNSSPTVTFTTATGAPQAPTGLNPVNGATSVSLNVTLSWGTSPGASSYDIYFGTSSAPPFAASVTATAYAPPALTGNTRYYWRVEAKNSSGSNSSPTFSFTTTNFEPSAPANLIPADGAINVPLTPTLSWSAAPGADSYDVYFGTAVNPPLATNTTGTSYTPTALKTDSVYFWRVEAKNSFGSSSSSTITFTTVKAEDTTPPVISGVAATTIATTSATITWSTNESADSQVDYGTTPVYGNATSTDANLVKNHSQMLSGLAAGTQYFFRVRSKDIAGNLAVSASFSFTTRNTVPDAPTNLNPADGMTAGSLTPVLSWSPSSGAEFYDVYFSTANPPSFVQMTSSTTYSPGALQEGTTYYWRVDARNGAGVAASETFKFTVTRKFKAALPRLGGNGRKEPNSSTYTGIAIANLGSADAQLQLTAYSQDGAIVAGAGIKNPVTVSLKPGQQIPILDTELFGEGYYSVAGGWLQLESSSEKITCYFMQFNSTLSMLEGAPIPSIGMTSMILPGVATRGSTQVSIANPDNNPANLTFRLVDSDGVNRETANRRVQPNGSINETFGTLFPGLTPASSEYIRVTSDRPVIPLEFIGWPGGDMEGLVGLDSTRGGKVLYSPQYAVGGGWSSAISVINLEPTAGVVRFRFLGNDGMQIGQTKRENISGYGKLYIDVPNYFGDLENTLVQGYLEIVSNGPMMTGSVSFGDSQRTSFAAALPFVVTLQNTLVFSHLASNDVFFTGLALLNPNEESTYVTIDVYAATGERELTTQLVVPSGGRISRLMTEYFPRLAGECRTSGYIKITSDRGIAAFALFGTQNLSALAALPAQNTP